MLTALFAFAISIAGLVAVAVLAQRCWDEADAVAPPRTHVRVLGDVGAAGGDVGDGEGPA